MTNKEILGLDVFGALRTGDIAILRQGKGNHVILINDICFDFVALCFKILMSPKNIAELLHELFDGILCFVEELVVAP